MTVEKSRYVHPTGFAFAITSGITYLVCALFIWLIPSQTMLFFGDWFHGIDLTKIAGKAITMGAFFRGLISVLLAAYLVGALYAWAYNKCVDHCRRKGWI